MDREIGRQTALDNGSFIDIKALIPLHLSKVLCVNLLFFYIYI